MEDLFVRYADALLSIAKDEKKVEAYKDAMTTLFEVFNKDESILKYLGSYFEMDNEKFIAIDKMCKPFMLPHLSSFMKLLVSKHLITHFNDIYKSFNKDANETLGIEEGFIYSTYPLSKEEIKRVTDSLQKRTTHKVELKNFIDESLIGGVKVVIHDRVYDGSIKYKLEKMKSNLIKGGAK